MEEIKSRKEKGRRGKERRLEQREGVGGGREKRRKEENMGAQGLLMGKTHPKNCK